MPTTFADEIRPFLQRPSIILLTAALLFVDLLLSGLIMNAGRAINGMTVIPGLLDMQFLWNRGISFSLLWQSSSFGTWVLAAFQTVVSVALLRWAVRSNKPFLSWSLACVAAGALGNVASRIMFGAVFDYLELHLGSVPLFVFNISDALISLGVVGILVEMLWPTSRTLDAGNSQASP